MKSLPLCLRRKKVPYNACYYKLLTIGAIFLDREGRNNKHRSVNLNISDREEKGDKSSGIEINDSSL
jgi:hypothetical protein